MRVLTERFGVLCFVSFSLGATDPVALYELADLEDNPAFVYEQREMPAELRSFLIPLAFVDMAGSNQQKWIKHYEPLLSGFTIASGIRFVAPSYAQATYRYLSDLCQHVGMATPLVFLSTDHSLAGGITAVPITSSLFGLVFDPVMFEDLDEQEMRTLIARELARISAGHCEKEELISNVRNALIAVIVALVTGWHIVHALKKESLEPILEMVRRHWRSVGQQVGFMILVTLLTGGLEWYLKRRYRKEAQKLTLEAFGGSLVAYEATLLAIEEKADIRAQKKKDENHLYYEYIQSRIEICEGFLDSEVIAAMRDAFAKICNRHDIYLPQTEIYGLALQSSSLKQRVRDSQEHALKRSHGRRYTRHGRKN